MGTLPRAGTAVVEVGATAEQVWTVLADPARTDEWGHESQAGEWLGDATAAAPGARFQGRNKHGRTKWNRVCEVLEADAPHHIVWRTVPSRLYKDSTSWTYDLEATAGGCRITQRFDVLSLGPIMDRLFHALIPAHRDRTEALQGDLRRLGEVAAKVTAPAR